MNIKSKLLSLLSVPHKIRSRRGATGVEYGLLVGLIGVMLIASVSATGNHIETLFRKVAGTLQNVQNNVSNEAAAPTPSDIAVAQFSGYRAWADGTFAANCKGYVNAPAGYSYSGATGDAVYRLTSGQDVYCDMTNGGWTLVARGYANNSLTKWISAEDIALSGTPSPTMTSTFRFSDAVVDTIRGTLGIYRLGSDGSAVPSGAAYRYYQARPFDADLRPSAATLETAFTSYANEGFTSGKKPIHSLHMTKDYTDLGTVGGLADDQINYNIFHVLWRGQNGEAWLVGDGRNNGSCTTATGCCSGLMNGCNIQLWVK